MGKFDLMVSIGNFVKLTSEAPIYLQTHLTIKIFARPQSSKEGEVCYCIVTPVFITCTVIKLTISMKMVAKRLCFEPATVSLQAIRGRIQHETYSRSLFSSRTSPLMANLEKPLSREVLGKSYTQCGPMPVRHVCSGKKYEPFILYLHVEYYPVGKME